ncbi:hypothetical protein QQ045_032204 [Rhodiola kirilowii]
MGGAADGFVTRAFESMLKECSGKKYSELKKAIQAYLDDIKAVKKQPPADKPKEDAQPAGHVSLSEADAVATENGTGSDHVQQYIDAGAPNADTSVTSGGRGTITAALSNAGNVLEGAEAELVLNPLRLAFGTKNLKVQEPALDCLHKLIAYDHLEGDAGLESGRNSALFSDILTLVCSCVNNSSSDSTVLQVLKVLLTVVSSEKFRVHDEPLLWVIRVCYNIVINSKRPINQAMSKAMLTQMINIVCRRMEKDIAPPVPLRKHEIPDGNSSSDPNEKEMNLGDAISMNQAKKMSIASVEELHTLAGDSYIKGLEAVLDKAMHFEDSTKTKRGFDLESMSIGHRDALLLFRTLCKMGMKEDNDELTTKSRILSLELLQGLLEGVGHSLTKNFHFIDSVKAYLSYALLRASVAHSHKIFQYAAGIFSVLLLRFRESLKGEIGVFFPLIVLRPLDSSDFNHKMSVLRMLEKICKDPQMLVDIYVNYDCDLEAPNMFERMATALSKVAQGTQKADPSSAAVAQNNSIKGSALQCLVNVLNSLIDWEKSVKEKRKQSKSSQPIGVEVSSMDSADTNNSDDMLGNFEKEKAHKSTLESAILEFNRGPVKGIDYLISNRLVENKPTAIAHFLKNTPSLDKSMIGDYLGQHEEFPLSVMHAYVDSLNFSGMKFDTAIRELLKGFCLPGEAQKIDRIMEKFAERFCADNPGLFQNADTAYVLAYAAIMLNTDAHNPMVWPKMSKSDFVRMNVTDYLEECAPQELLVGIYDSIVKDEIKMTVDTSSFGNRKRLKSEGEEGSQIVRILNLALPRSKILGDSKSESESTIKLTQAQSVGPGANRGVIHTCKQIKFLRPMIESIGWPLLATISFSMEEGEDNPRVALCLEGFKAAILLTNVLGMDTMRYAFLASLIRFTSLHALKDMRIRNVEAVRTLLDICDADPDSLQDTWMAVLECLSRLENTTSDSSMGATVIQGSNQISRDVILQSLRELSGKPTEQVYVYSVKLPSDSIVEFFNALCGVSAAELKQYPARVFSLQRLVEMSYYNMTRIRMVWARIWHVLANHLISAANHPDEKISMYAIDSLRQLGMKYLERAELASFTFQNDILKPFVVLMRNSQSETRKRLLVDCIVQMIKSKVGSIKSGWRSVFMIFTAAADDEMESIVEYAFENVEQVILELFDQVVGDCFVDCVNCLARFANNKGSHSISLKAIALLRICGDRLAEGLIPGGALMPSDANSEANFDVTEHYWFPMLAGLSDLTSDSRPEVRSCALEVLFDLLNERGSNFSSIFWESIFHRVLFPILDHVRQTGKEESASSGEDWLQETSAHSLQLLCDLFNKFYKEVCFMLPSLLSLLLDCAKKTNQVVVSISLGALVHLIEVGGQQFGKSEWDTLLKGIRDASYTTQPLELLDAFGSDNSKNHSILKINVEPVDDRRNVSHKSDASDYRATSPIGSPSAGLNSSVVLSGSQSPGSEGIASPSGRVLKPAEVDGLPCTKTFGQRIMGNMIDSLFMRSLTSKPKVQSTEAPSPTLPSKLNDVSEFDGKEEESPLLETVRRKCITQLLLLGAIDSIQRKYWSNLTASQKVTIMDIIFSMLKFSASYNSYTNLQTRLNQNPAERPPLNLLRQELVGTCIYLDILQKTTSRVDCKGDNMECNGSKDENASANERSDADGKLEGVAEEKLVSFCGQVLSEASEIQSTLGETIDMNVHRVLELRSPIIVKAHYGGHF